MYMELLYNFFTLSLSADLSDEIMSFFYWKRGNDSKANTFGRRHPSPTYSYHQMKSISSSALVSARSVRPSVLDNTSYFGT